MQAIARQHAQKKPGNNICGLKARVFRVRDKRWLSAANNSGIEWATARRAIAAKFY
jgi:hypothetical protein